MAIVDQLFKETAAFHEDKTTDLFLAMQHIHEQSWNHGKAKPVTLKQCRAKGNRRMRDILKAELFALAIQSLKEQGMGVVEGKSYRASREMHR